MPVSEEVFKELQSNGGFNPAPAPTNDSVAAEKSKADQSAMQTALQGFSTFVGNQVEHAKNAVAQTAELTNAGARLFMASVNPAAYLTGDFGPISKGAATKAMNVDTERLKKEGAISKGFGAMTEGVTSSMIFPAPGMGAAKNLVMGAGMGEGSEVGKFVFGGIGSVFDGPDSNTGREIGEDVGSVVGGAVGGPLNNVRVNAMAKGAAEAGKQGANAVGSVFPAVKSTWQAKGAGDTRAAFDIFMDHYSDLRSKSKSLLQERTNQKLAAILQRNPDHQQAVYDFDQATRATGVAKDQFTLAQQTADPTLLAVERANQGATAQDIADRSALKEGQKASIANTYKAVTSKALPTDAKSLTDSTELYRAGSVARVDKLETAADQVRQNVANWTDTDAAKAGQQFRGGYDKALGESQQRFAEQYNNVYKQADQSGTRYDLAPVAKETKAILKPLLAQIDTPAAPNSIRRLNELLTRSEKTPDASKSAILDQSGQAFDAQVQATVQPKGYSFREVDEVVQELGKDAHAAFNAGDSVQGQNLNKIGKALLDVLDKQSPAEVRQAYAQTRADYATQHVPRFRQGVNYNMDREAASSRSQRERITDQNVWNQYLDKKDLVDKMQQFDNLASGKLGKKMPEAYKGLEQAVQDRYSKEVLAGGFTREKHDKFMRSYNSALDRVPAARQHVEQTADNLDGIAQRKATELEQYHTATGLPFASKVGPVQAQQMFIQAMADPVKMEKLLASKIPAQSVLKEAMTFADPMKSGAYDPEKLVELLNMGERRPGQATPMQMLFDKALGPREGAAHSTRLNAIAELMQRERMTDTNMKIDKTGGPVMQATGQSAASWLTGARSMSAGFGSHYYPLVAAGRFVNNSMQKALTQAQRRALYDPEMSKAILELAQTPNNQPLSMNAWNKVYGGVDGARKVMKELLDHGLIRTQAARGALYGYQQNVTDDDRDSKKPKRQMNLPQ